MTNRAEIKPLRFFAGLAILLVALYLQIFLASAGWHFNLALAALIVLAFIFNFLELLILDLATVFILNWQPAPSAALIAFALIPLAVFFARKLIQSEPWIGVLVAIITGFFVFYLAAASTPASAFFFAPAQFSWFVVDVMIAAIVGEMTLMALN